MSIEKRWSGRPIVVLMIKHANLKQNINMSRDQKECKEVEINASVLYN